MYQACGSSKNSKLNHADPQGTQSRGGGGETVSGLAPCFPCGAGKSCLYCNTRKTNGKKKWGTGKERRVDEKMNNNVNSHHAGVFKTAPFRKLQTTYPDPNVYPNTPQPSLFSVVRPALNLVQRPRPQGWGGGRERRGAGLSRSLYALLPRRP